MQRWLVILVLLLVPVITAGKQVNDGNDPRIDSLRQKIYKLQLGYLNISEIQFVESGFFTPANSPNAITGLPAFCRIAAILRPVAGSEIKMELWLPINSWNGRFLGTGNGGGAGSIVYTGLAGGIKKGCATANTDLGTSRGGADRAIGKPEVWSDFGYRATHLMTVVSKAILQCYYGRAQQYAYFTGCSTGGQQALMEAQRFPEDYNGIIAGAPANNRTHLHTEFLYNYKLTNTNGRPLFTKQELAFITRKITAVYAVRTGGAPGDLFLTDPGLISVDFDALFKSKSGSADTCLNDSQIEALKKIYSGPVNPKTGEQIYTSPPVGSENISGGISSQQTEDGAHGLFYPFKWTFGKNFNPGKFDFDLDVFKLDSLLSPILNSNNPDLSAFKNLGGKIIMFTGTADPLVPYQDAVNYYERVIEKQGGLKQTQQFFKYYLIPGMAHCGGGPGLNGFSRDILLDLISWVERGKPPEQLEATAFNCCVVNAPPRFKRPVFPYPKFPQYAGGDVKLVSSYVGQEHPRNNVLKPAKKYEK